MAQEADTPETADAALTRNGGITYLHIPAVDTKRAATFYEQVFGWIVRDRDSRRPSFEDQPPHICVSRR